MHKHKGDKEYVKNTYPKPFTNGKNKAWKTQPLTWTAGK
jgi:hypothetical protein